MPPVRTQPGYDTEQIEGDLATVRGAHDALSEYAELTTAVVSAVIVADLPGQTHSLAGDGTPMTQETWHVFTPLSNNWVVPAGGSARYRITVNNELQISAWIQAPAATINNVTICNFPAAYRPASVQGAAVGADVANNAAAAADCLITVGTGGNMQAQGVGASANVYINVRLPLD